MVCSLSNESVTKQLVSILAGRRQGQLGTAEWQSLVGLAQSNGLGGILYRMLKDSKTIPKDERETLRKLYYSQAAQALMFEQTYLKVEGILRQAGVELIPLNGIVFRYLLYDDPAERGLQPILICWFGQRNLKLLTNPC